MKKLLLLFFCVSSLLAVTPKWFYNLDKQSANHYIGYGEASTLKEAKNIALSAIASEISLRVKSSFSSSVKVDNDVALKEFENKQSQKSDADLSGSKVLKLTEIEDRFFVQSCMKI